MAISSIQSGQSIYHFSFLAQTHSNQHIESTNHCSKFDTVHISEKGRAFSQELQSTKNEAAVDIGIKSDRTEPFSTLKRMTEPFKTSGKHFSIDGLINKFMDGIGKDEVITVDEIFAYSEKYQKKAEKILYDNLGQLEISSATKITIDTEPEGNIKISADLPENILQDLEQTLNNHADFQQCYVKATSSFTLAKGAESQSDFARAYEKNPKYAIARFGIEYESDFVMEFSNGKTKMVNIKEIS